MNKYVYKNGNYVVFRGENDNLIKRPFRTNEKLIAEFPDSIDLKITNKCSWGCPFCHESSVSSGKIGDVERIKEVISELPFGIPIEIAVGGGNILDSPKETLEVLRFIKSRGHLPRITINRQDLQHPIPELEEIVSLVDGVGVSLSSLPRPIALVDDWPGAEQYSLRRTLIGDIGGSKLSNRFYYDGCKLVVHIIAGVFPVEDLDDLFRFSDIPILILGYKQWGRAKNNALPESMQEFEKAVKIQMYKARTEYYDYYFRSKIIAFDNLALEQLDIKSALTDSEWNTFYLGDEGSHSMYIDAVEGKFARTSRSEDRVSWDSIRLLDYFKSL